jgi:Leucine-rich repeat (LRR) protein
MQTLEICKHNLCGFFNVVNQLQICDNEDFTLDSVYKERERFSLVTNLNILPSKVIWILCEIVRIAEDGSLVIRPGFANNEEIQGLDDYEVIIDDETNRKLVCADCADLQDLKLPFMAHKSSSGVIGIAYIQIKMLKAQLMKDPLAMVLGSNLFKGVSSKLTGKQLGILRSSAGDIKQSVDSVPKQTIFYLDRDYDYSSEDELRKLWTRHGKRPEDCTIDLYLQMENDEHGNLRFTRTIDALIESNAKISAKFDIPTRLLQNNQEIYLFLFRAIERLQNIVSIEIDFNRRKFSDKYFIPERSTILCELPFLSTLHMKNTHKLSLYPLLNCVKNIPKLKELHFTNVNLVDTQNLTDDNPRDNKFIGQFLDFCRRYRFILEENGDEFQLPKFVIDFCGLLIHSNITTIRINDSCTVDSADNKFFLLDEIALCLNIIEQIAREYPRTKINRVTSLDMSYSSAYNEPELFRYIFTSRMLNLVHLKEFNISSNELGEEGLNDLLPILRGLPNLETLNISDNEISLEVILDYDGLIPDLLRLTKLKTLYIGDNGLSDDDIALIQEVLPRVEVLEK